jgi:small-conductance mechanosensitive channel
LERLWWILAFQETPHPTKTHTVEEGVGRLQEVIAAFHDALPTVGIGIAVFALFLVVAGLVKFGIRRYAAGRGRHGNLVLAAGRLMYASITIVGFLVACVVVFPGFTPTGMLTSLGIGSLVIGLAFKDVLQNYLAGILLLIAEPFHAGDQIVYNEFEGSVEDIQPRATFIRTYDGRRVVIPNAELFTNAITVNTAFDIRRVEYDLGIGYGDHIEKAKPLILEAIRESGTTLDDPAPEVLTYDLADCSVKLRLRWWIRPPRMRELLDARDEVLAAVKDKLVRNGIDIPSPRTRSCFTIRQRYRW